MLYTIGESTGIDSQIEDLKAKLYDDLKVKFPSISMDGFGRVYSSRREVGLVPEYLIGNTEYRDVYLDDTKDVVFSFIISDSSNTEDGYLFTNEVKAVFFVNLDRLYGSYLDQKAHNDFVSIIRNRADQHGLTVTGVERGVEQVFSGFYTESIKNADVAPWHCFSILVDVPYFLNQC